MASKIPMTDLPIRHYLDMHTYKIPCGAAARENVEATKGYGATFNIYEVTCPKCKEIIDGRNTRSK